MRNPYVHFRVVLQRSPSITVLVFAKTSNIYPLALDTFQEICAPITLMRTPEQRSFLVLNLIRLQSPAEYLLSRLFRRNEWNGGQLGYQVILASILVPILQAYGLRFGDIRSCVTNLRSILGGEPPISHPASFIPPQGGDKQPRSDDT